MRQFGFFAKYWQPGAVKTRLGQSIGASAASRLYQQFLAVVLDRFDHAADRCVIGFTPPERADQFRRLADDRWQLEPQCAGNLGERMLHYFDRSFAAGADKTVLIGSDSPSLPAEYVEQAFAALDAHPIVLGPSDDGGYYLIGLSRPLPAIFAGVDWSTPRVWRQTIECISAERLSFCELPLWYDVDELAGLERLATELNDDRTLAGPLLNLREAINKVLADE